MARSLLARRLACQMIRTGELVIHKELNPDDGPDYLYYPTPTSGVVVDATSGTMYTYTAVPRFEWDGAVDVKFSDRLIFTAPNGTEYMELASLLYNVDTAQTAGS